MPLSPPCPRCGDTRAEPMYRSVFYPLFKRFGYRLCYCGRCRRKRIFRRHEGRQDYKTEQKTPMARARAAPAAVGNIASDSVPPKATETGATAGNEVHKAIETPAPPPARSPHISLACPFCFSRNCRPSRRKLWERWLGKPKMMRCRQCRRRFPRPTQN